jgi:Haem-dependent oxidative N-demethylase, alpha subunit-like
VADAPTAQTVSERAVDLALDDRGWRLAMGLRPLDLSAWLEVDERREEELALKARLVAERRDAVVATRPSGDAPSAELLDTVVDWLGAHHPSLERGVDESEHPLIAASRLVQEDLCVLVRSDTWRLEAASVCFPSRWLLASKIGATLDQIHDPVPGYDEELSRPTTSVFDRLRPERSFWRLNWTLLDAPELHQPEVARDTVAGPVTDWFFRVERQTIRRLRASGAVVFTIRTYVRSFAEMATRHDDFAANVLRALDEAPPAMRAYKGWRGVAERLREAGST